MKCVHSTQLLQQENRVWMHGRVRRADTHASVDIDSERKAWAVIPNQSWSMNAISDGLLNCSSRDLI